MSYPSYLIHYNKNHSKTNGQFVSGDGDGDGISNDHANQNKTAFNGSSKKEYISKMQSEYRSNGASKLQAKKYANYAAMMNQAYTKNYNKNTEKAKVLEKKANAEKAVGNMKAYEKYSKELAKEYKNAKINSKLIEKSYELGKAYSDDMDFMFLFGTVAYAARAANDPNSLDGIIRKVTKEVEENS